MFSSWIRPHKASFPLSCTDLGAETGIGEEIAWAIEGNFDAYVRRTSYLDVSKPRLHRNRWISRIYGQSRQFGTEIARDLSGFQLILG